MERKVTLPFWAKWVARDEDNALYVFENKPVKEGEYWVVFNGDYLDFPMNSFPHVKWEDKEPTLINALERRNVEGTLIIDEPDMVNNPPHYNQGGIETLNIIKLMLTPEEYRGYLKGNIIKYRERAQFKGKPEEDYAKARFYFEEVTE